MTRQPLGGGSAFGQGEAPGHPGDGTIIRKNADTVDVTVPGSLLRNVAISPPLEIDSVAEGDDVALWWDSAGRPYVIAVLGRHNAYASDARQDVTPPPPPSKIAVFQNQGGAYLKWNHPPRYQKELAYYEVDARLVGGSWGFSMYPLSEGTSNYHYPRTAQAVQCRVRSVDVRGNTSAWVECSYVLQDQIAPETPTGLAALSKPNAVVLSWFGPTLSLWPDLAGFNVLLRLDGDSSAQTIATVGPALTTTIELPPGTGGYWSLKAFDRAGNVSDACAEVGPVYAGFSGSPNMLPNSDLEIDLDADNVPDEWSFLTTDATVVTTISALGYAGGSCAEVSLDGASGTKEAALVWGPYFSDHGISNTVCAGETYYVSALVKATGCTPVIRDVRTKGSGDAGIYASVHLYFSDGLSSPSLSDVQGPVMTVNQVELDDDWVEVHASHAVTASDIASGALVGVAVFVTFEDGGYAGSEVVHIDRVQLTRGNELTRWMPGIVPSGGGIGLDVLGIKSTNFKVDADGYIRSSLLPEGTGLSLGSAAKRWTANIDKLDCSGDITIASGKVIDGVDISAHAVDADAHHDESHALSSHSDIQIVTPGAEQYLAYNSGTSKWENKALAINQVSLDDNEKVILGTGTDLEMYHNGTNTIFDINTGELRLSSDAGATNYLAIEGDGTLEFNGNATVWDDLRVMLEQAKATGSNQPAWTKVKDNGSGSAGVYAWEFDDGDEIWFSVQIPHSWKEGSTIYPHLHWCSQADATGYNVGIGLEYTWADMTETFGNTTLISRDVAGSTAYTHLVHNFDDAGISGSGHTISSVLLCRFYRRAALANNYTGALCALEIDFHYEIDTVGSRQVTSK